MTLKILIGDKILSYQEARELYLELKAFFEKSEVGQSWPLVNADFRGVGTEPKYEDITGTSTVYGVKIPSDKPAPSPTPKKTCGCGKCGKKNDPILTEADKSLVF